MIELAVVRNSDELEKCGIWELYERSFPWCERRSLVAQRRAMASAEGFHCCKILRSGDVVGLMFYWQLPQFIFVEHLAVVESCRGQGVGRSALALLGRKGLPIILEIELPTDEATDRRLQFYLSCGFVELSVEHVQLPFHEDSSPVPMRLLSWPAPMSAVDVALLEQYLKDVVMSFVDGSST